MRPHKQPPAAPRTSRRRQSDTAPTAPTATLTPARASTTPPQAHPADDAAFIQFLDLAGHDLRVPITAMKGQMQLLQRRLRRQQGRETELNDVGKVLYQVERLQQHLATLLEAAHAAQHRLDLLPGEHDLMAVISRLTGIYDAGDSAHAIVVNSEVDSLPGVFDRTRVEVVLSVLFGNAFKYASEGTIEVTVTSADDVARVEVSDAGIGVPSAERRAIFNAYTSGSNIENPGVGLGLFVAREIIRMHHGRMGMRARKGGGSTFWFTLPLHSLQMPTYDSGASYLPAFASASANAPVSQPERAEREQRKPTLVGA